MEEQEKINGEFDLNFSSNWNNKLNNTYFTTIRKSGSYITTGSTYNILLKDKCIKQARCIKTEIVKLHEIPLYVLMLDTGYSYSESLDLFRQLGMEVSNLELKVKICCFKSSPQNIL